MSVVSSSLDRLRRDPGLAMIVVAVAAVVAIYAPTLGRGLVNYDDTWLVRDNFLLHQASWASVHTILFDTSSATRFLLGAEYLPVRDLSVLADLAVWGDWYPGHHLTSLLIYLGAIVVWFAALDSLGIDRKLVGLAMLLWAVHPSHAESVAWISERKGLLGVAWCGLAVLGYARFRVGRSASWLALAALAAVLAVWSKAPSVFTLAAIAGLELALPARRRSWRRSLSGLAVLAAVSAAAFVPVLLVATRLSVVGTTDLAPAGWLAMVVGLHGFYLELAAMLFRNAISYPIKSLGPSAVQIVLGAAGLLAVLAAAMVPAWNRWRPPPVIRAAAWVWLLGWFPASRILLPLKAVLVSDRYALVPTLGFALAVAWLLQRIPARWSRLALGWAILIAASVRTLDAQSNWRDSTSLFERAITSNPADGEAWSYYAEALESSGAPDRAVDVVSEGLRHSRSPRLLFRKALLVLSHGQRPQAVVAMRQAAEAGEPRAMSNLALLLLEDGRPDEGLTWARRAVAAAPMYSKAYRNLGTVALATKHPEEAYTAFLRAYELWPIELANRYNLAAALVELHRYEEARVHLDACLLDPQVGDKAKALLLQLPR